MEKLIEPTLDAHNCWDTIEGKPVWIVNDLAELGVLVNGRTYFLYKANSLQYSGEPTSEAKRYRRVQKREFGEVCRVPGLEGAPEKCDYGADEGGEGWHDIQAPTSVMHAPMCTQADAMFPTGQNYCGCCGARLTPHVDIVEYANKLQIAKLEATREHVQV